MSKFVCRICNRWASFLLFVLAINIMVKPNHKDDWENVMKIMFFTATAAINWQVAEE